MKKFCIFCGEKPSNKNKEHIIPKWLIRLTGELHREINIGRDWTSNKFEMRKFKFSSYTFPACKACNDEFATLESEAKFILLKITNEEPTTDVEINTLLDWFDKIRIGLWFSGVILNKNHQKITPHFYIKNRVRRSDRALVIYKNDDTPDGITFIGTDGPIFHSMPSVFGLKINKLHFVSISNPLFLHKSLGLSYPTKHEMDSVSEVSKYTFEEGSGTVKIPELLQSLPKSNITFLQAIIPMEFTESDYGLEVYITDYDKQMFGKLDDKVSNIYSIKNDIVKEISDIDTYLLPDKNNSFLLHYELGSKLLDLQLDLYGGYIITGQRTEDVKEIIRGNILIHKTIQNIYKQQMTDMVNREMTNLTS